MADRHRVQCVDGADQPRPEERIVRIGGTNTVGVNWRLSQAEAIDGIEGGRWAFYVLSRTGRALDVIVVTSPSGAKYLSTSADDDQADPLLALKACG